MKLLVVPDIHGRSELLPTKEEMELCDKCILLGDYFDSFDIQGQEQLTTFKLVLLLINEYPDKVEALIGNHELHYLYLSRLGEFKCSGFNPQWALKFHLALRDNRHKFKFAWQYGEHLFTHAGMQIQVYDALFKRFPQFKAEVEEGKMNIADIINGCEIPEFFYIGKENGGCDLFSGIFWTRPKQLNNNLIPNYIQHVGHTVVSSISKSELQKEGVYYYDGLGKIFIDI